MLSRMGLLQESPVKIKLVVGFLVFTVKVELFNTYFWALISDFWRL